MSMILTRFIKCVQFWLHCQLLLAAVSATAFETFEDDDHIDESTFDMDEIGCPGIPTLQSVDLKTFFGEWYLPFASDNWMRYGPTPGPRPRFGTVKKPFKKSAYAHTCIKSTIRPIPTFPPLPAKRWRPRDNVRRNAQNATGTAQAAKRRDYTNIWIRTKCPRTGQESNLNCKPFPEVGSIATHARLVCLDFANALSPPTEFYIVDSDNQSYALVVTCVPTSFSDDDDRKPNINAWAIFVKMSTHKMVSPELIKELLSLVEHIGFKVGGIIEIPYEKCRY